MFGVQKNRVHAYEMLPCKALRAMKTGTECPQVQISNILGRGEKKKKGAFTSYPTVLCFLKLLVQCSLIILELCLLIFRGKQTNK